MDNVLDSIPHQMSGQACDDLNNVTSAIEKEFTRKKNIYFKGLGACLVLRLQRSQSKRPVVDNT